MGTFKLSMSTDNAAFISDGQGLLDHEARNEEVARILRVVVARLEKGVDGGLLLDINGNSVGEFSFE